MARACKLTLAGLAAAAGGTSLRPGRRDSVAREAVRRPDEQERRGSVRTPEGSPGPAIGKERLIGAKKLWLLVMPRQNVM